MTDSLKERLRKVPTVILDHHQVEQGAVIRNMMIDRAEALARIEALEKELAEERAARISATAFNPPDAWGME